jgi:hypothetical protein
MKRLNTVFIAVLGAALVCSSARAQSVVDTSSASRFYLGIKGGFALSTVWGPDRPLAQGSASEGALGSFLPGVSVGMNIPIIIRDHFIIEPELLFTTKGTQWIDSTNTFEEVKETVIRRHNHIDVPVLIKLVGRDLSKRFRPILYAGPQFSVNVLSYTKKKGEQAMSHSQNYWTLSDSTSWVDISLVGGVGMHLRAGRGFFVIDLRGHGGFLNMGNGEECDCFPRIIHNLYGVISIGYCFNPKKKKSLW